MTIEKAHMILEERQRLLTGHYGDERAHESEIEANGIAILAIEKQIPKKPIKESLADYLCAACGTYINFDGLNGKIEHAPKYCSECGQKIDWEVRENDR